jgi:hypothetical protein
MGVMDENRVRAEVPIVSGRRPVKSALADEAILPPLLKETRLYGWFFVYKLDAHIYRHSL